MGMQRFNDYLAKEQVSSSNTLPSELIFINLYYFVIKKGDRSYVLEYHYQLLIENSQTK